MSEENLTPEVLHFIDACIPTVPHMEALLLIWQTKPRSWTAAELAARIYVTEDAVSQILWELERCGLLQREGAQSASFRYDPRSDWDSTLPVVLQTYRRHLSGVARYIHSRGPKAILEFSRAFRLRKDQ